MQTESVLPIPHTVEEVSVEREWERTCREGSPAQELSGQWLEHIGVCYSGQLRHSHAQESSISTEFQACPAPYSQLVTIHRMYSVPWARLALCDVPHAWAASVLGITGRCSSNTCEERSTKDHWSQVPSSEGHLWLRAGFDHCCWNRDPWSLYL